MLKRVVDPAAVFFIVTFAVLLVVFQTRGLTDPGTFWHTRVGGIILTHGFMSTDPFTFPFEGKTWIPQQWGGEVLMAKLHEIGGFDTLLFAFLAIFLAGFTLVFRRLMNAGMGWPLAAGITAFALAAAGFHFFVRPHVFTIVFTIVLTAILADYDAGKCTMKKLLWLIPLHIVWTNIHGGMLGGLFTLGLAIAGWTVERAFFQKRWPISGLQCWGLHLALWFACALTMLANPIGLELQSTWFRLIGSSALGANIAEHTPLDITRGGDQALLGFAVLYIFLLLGTLPRRPRLFWLMPLAWLALSVTSIRNGPLFVATAAVVVADLWPHTVYYRKLLVSGDLLASKPGLLGKWHPTSLLLPGLIVLLGLVLQAKRVPVPLFGSGWSRFDEGYVPQDMIDAVRDIPAKSKIYNDANFGGFLIWSAPTLKIFMDDRFELCGDEWLRNYVDVIQNHPQRFDDWQRQYGFDWALVVHKKNPDASLPALDQYLQHNSRWVVVAKGHIATLYKMKP